MRRDNPACYECPKSRTPGGLHSWHRNSDGTARCEYCKLVLSPADAEDCWRQ